MSFFGKMFGSKKTSGEDMNMPSNNNMADNGDMNMPAEDMEVTHSMSDDSDMMSSSEDMMDDSREGPAM